MNMISSIPSQRTLARSTVRFVRTRPRWQKAALLASPLALVAGYAALAGGDGDTAAAPPTPTVTIAQPLQRQVDQWDDYVGRFEASRSVEVRPRVAGQIIGVHFTDGAIVQKGQLLFTLDPRPFNAALAEARAGVATAQSELNLAQINLGRARRLLENEAVSRATVDQLTGQVQVASASLAAAQARLRQKALDLEFSRIRAPIGGRISDRKIDSGNLVSAGEAGGTLLTTINALDPIYFSFDVPESLFLKTSRQKAEGREADIRLQDEADYRWHGRLDFTDNGLSQTSGTVRARVVLPNPGLFLTPGLFGNMRLKDGGTANALLVPDAAIRVDQARKVVFTVGKDGTVAARPVETGPLVGSLRVIRTGLTPQDRVVVQGIQFAMPGSKVNVKPTRIADTALSAPAGEGPSRTPAASQATLAAR